MRIGVPKEIHKGERRIATTPEAAEFIKNLGFEIAIESGAGLGADFTDEAFGGVTIVKDAKTLYDILYFRPSYSVNVDSEVF